MELPEFSDDRYWTRVRARETIGKNKWIVIEGKEILRFGYVFDNRKMISCSESQLEALADYLLQVLGIMHYVEYITNKVPRKELIKW